MSLFSAFGNALFGVPQTNTAPYVAAQNQSQQAAQGYAGREQGAYNNQQQLSGSLWNTINGRGPSVADIRLQQALDQVNKQYGAMGSGASGANAVLARYLASGAGGDAATQAAQAGGLLKAQETANAQQQLAGLTGAMAGESGNLYGASLSNGLGYANLTNNATQANANRDLQTEAAGLNALSGAGQMFFSRLPSGSGGASGGSLAPGGDAFAPGGAYGGGLNPSDAADFAALGA